MITPHRRPIPNKTKVRVRSYTLRREGVSATVVGPRYQYASPFEQRNGYGVEGTYFSDDEYWSDLWVVRLIGDSGVILEERSLADLGFVSGYRWGIPLFRWFVSKHMHLNPFRWSTRRLGDLPYPICFYPGDLVVYAQDESKTPRRVSNIWFGLDGHVTYSLLDTKKERTEANRRAKEAAEKTGDSYMVLTDPGNAFHRVSEVSMELVERGNHYHLVKGVPENLSFPHITLEVEFWKDIGLWIHDFPSRKATKAPWASLVYDEALKLLHEGVIDSIQTGREREYNPIRLPKRFAAFRARSRAASIEYLEKFAGKCSFDIFPEEELED